MNDNELIVENPEVKIKEIDKERLAKDVKNLRGNLLQLRDILNLYISDIDNNAYNILDLEQFAFGELPNEILNTLQSNVDDIREQLLPHYGEETVINSVEGWRITDPNQISAINKLFKSDHSYFEVEMVETVNIDDRSIMEYIVVVADDSARYHPPFELWDELSDFIDREPDYAYDVKE